MWKLDAEFISFVCDWQDLSVSVLMKLLKLECETAVSSQQSRVFPLHIFRVILDQTIEQNYHIYLHISQQILDRFLAWKSGGWLICVS